MIGSDGIRFSRVPMMEGIDAVKNLHNRLFRGTAASEEWFRWYYTRVANKVRVYGAFDDEKLVGIWCVESKIADINGKKCPTGRCFSVGVDDNYRRRNIFVNLSKFAIKSEQEAKMCDYIFGFPQVGRPVVEAHLKSGWYHVHDIDIMSLKPEHGNTSLSHVQELSNFLAVEDTRRSGSFLEDTGYKNSRWLQHPDHHYICLTRGSGYVVLKHYADICHILDMDASADELRVLLDATATLGWRHRWREINVWCSVLDDRRQVLEAAGFANGADTASPVSLLAVNVTATENINLQSCHFQMGNEEMY